MDALIKLRDEINSIDKQLLNLISQRLAAVKKIGEIKKRIGRPIRDEQRERALLSELGEQGKRLNLDNNFIKRLWQVLFEEAYKIEK